MARTPTPWSRTATSTSYTQLYTVEMLVVEMYGNINSLLSVEMYGTNNIATTYSTVPADSSYRQPVTAVYLL